MPSIERFQRVVRRRHTGRTVNADTVAELRIMEDLGTIRNRQGGSPTTAGAVIGWVESGNGCAGYQHSLVIAMVC